MAMFRYAWSEEDEDEDDMDQILADYIEVVDGRLDLTRDTLLKPSQGHETNVAITFPLNNNYSRWV